MRGSARTRLPRCRSHRGSLREPRRLLPANHCKDAASLPAAWSRLAIVWCRCWAAGAWARSTAPTTSNSASASRLKFLPADRLNSNSWRDQFYAEVRMARQVSHPNVCRVYDVGESDGHLFLSMEFVDGEDLASLLRRIGRLPDDKAVEIAQQLCGGLAAAHRSGVLHRDLKPSNVMIDGKGHARITDFGLAVATSNAEKERSPAGTPGYLAPELYDGHRSVGAERPLRTRAGAVRTVHGKAGIRSVQRGRVSPQTVGNQSYAAFECRQESRSRGRARNLALSGSRPRAAPAVCIECLCGSARWRSAGGRARSWGNSFARDGRGGRAGRLAAAGDGMDLFSFCGGAHDRHADVPQPPPLSWGRTPMNKSPEVLTDRAQELSEKLGYSGALDRASWIETEYDYLDYVADNPAGKNLASAGVGRPWPAPVSFWYRQSPEWMTPSQRQEYSDVTQSQPPYETVGMVALNLDMQGKLLFLRAVPPQVEAGNVREPDWSLLFDAAGLDKSQFHPAEPKWSPPEAFDSRADWEGHIAGQPDLPLHVAAAAYRRSSSLLSGDRALGQAPAQSQPRVGRSEGEDCF